VFDQLDMREELRRAKLVATEGRDLAERLEVRLQNRVARVFYGVEPHSHAGLTILTNGGFTTIEIDFSPVSGTARPTASVYLDGTQIFAGTAAFLSHDFPTRAGSRHTVRVETQSPTDVKIALSGISVRVI
jgi:hypothetical protein